MENDSFMTLLHITRALNVTDKEYAEIYKYCPLSQMITKIPNKKDELLEKIESIRKMIKFFVIITVISLIISSILETISASIY